MCACVCVCVCVHVRVSRAVASGVKGGDNSRGPHCPGGPTKSRNYTI